MTDNHAAPVSVTLAAYAKINTYLEVLGKREDGYHELCSHMQLITLADTLQMEVLPSESGGQEISLACDVPDVPTGEENLICRAARAFLTAFSVTAPIKISFTLQKRIPMQGGLAGGSADAAAALLALRDVLAPSVTDDALCRLGATLGADVPFCIVGRTGAQTARGIGEKMTRAPGLPRHLTLLIVLPGTAVSTPAAFRALDERSAGRDARQLVTENETRYSAFLDAMERENIEKIADASFNRFEEVVFPKQERTATAFQNMQRYGAAFVRMSGSGPTVVGYFAEAGMAEQARAQFEKSGYTAIVAHTL